MKNLYTPKTALPNMPVSIQKRSEEDILQIAYQLALDSIVLLKNDANLLPFRSHSRLAVFGRSQLDTHISGMGSGAARNVTNAKIILDECIRAGLEPVSALSSFYREQIGKEVQINPFAELFEKGADLVNSGIVYEIFGKYQPAKAEYSVPEELVATAKAETDTALLIIGRASGGEECDRHVPQDYELTNSEKELVSQVCSNFSHVALILNTNGVIDTGWIAGYPMIESVIFIGLPGQEGAAALADILVGTVSPSGKLCSTFALSYEDYPTAQNFSWNKDVPDSIREYRDYDLDAAANGSIGFAKSPVTVYEEDIYMGYRYFDSFGREVMWPFGFGLSYADFSITDARLQKTGDILSVCTKITNISENFAGKEIAQVYISAPWGKLEKPYQELKAFAKTDTLSPGASQELTMEIPIRALASYDEESASYILEEGTYYVRLGNSSRSTHIIGSFEVPRLVVCAELANRLGIRPENKKKLQLFSAKDQAAVTYAQEKEEMAVSPSFMITQEDVTIESPAGETVCENIQSVPSTLQDVADGKVSAEAFAAQLSLEELAVLAAGFGPGLPFGGLGSKASPTIQYENGEDIATSTHKTGNMGYVSPALVKYHIPSIFYKDGPASVGMTAWPTDMLLACSFNPELLYEFGSACGYEAALQDVDSWLAPALNLHRNPICGRNFEYFSEDPLLTGVCGVAICRGAEENNPITTCPKHFAINEQETYRRGSKRFSYDAVDSIISERAARELYLKPFEMVVRGSHANTFMSAFNKINGTFAAGNADLCTHILREEWGFEGIVVTDWGDMDTVVDGADAVAAGNDIVMPGGPPVIAEILKGCEEGRVTRKDLERTAIRLFHVILHSKSWLDYRT